MTIKDAAYHESALRTGVQARLGRIRFRAWDTLSAILAAIARRLGEQSAANDRITADYFISSAQGDALIRRGTGNENTPPKAAVGSTGTVTVTRPSGGGAITITAETLTMATVPDQNGVRQAFTTSADLSLGAGVTSGTVAATSTSTGLATNILTGTLLQITSTSGLVTGATAASDFTGGDDAESMDAYRARLILLDRSKAKAIGPALEAAALGVPGVAFVQVVKQPDSDPPVLIYAADATGALGTDLLAAVTAAVEAVAAAGIAVGYSAPDVYTANFTIPLVLDPAVDVDLTTLKSLITADVTAYALGLNSSDDRVDRVNRVKDIVMSYKRYGILDLTDSSFLPASNTTLAAHQQVVMGTITWP